MKSRQFIAHLQDSQGQLASDNSVIYSDAFNGLKADVQYTYKRGGFEQDVILREQPPAPDTYGFNPASTVLEVVTEFINPPTPTITETGSATSDQVDDTVTWGPTTIGHGKAFDLSDNQTFRSMASVNKRYVTNGGRNFLIERVRMKTIQPQLSSLPTQASIRSKLPMIATKEPSFPQIPAGRTDVKPMIKLAAATLPDKGYVLDYVAIVSSETNFTFQGDTTYYVGGEYNLVGTTTIEGGTVIKRDYSGGNNNGIDIDQNGTLVCATAPYRPAIFTSINDNSVGEIIGGSSGTPGTWDTFNFLNINATNASIHDLRFSHCLLAVNQNWGAMPAQIDVWNCQFMDVDVAVIGYNIGLHNVLIGSSVQWDDVVQIVGPNLVAENVTADGGDGFIEVDYPGSASVMLTNCLITRQPLLGVGSATIYTNNVVWIGTPYVSIYQTVGGGNYYLTNGSPYRNCGTTNISPALLAALRQKTTYPPIVYSNMTIVATTNYSTQVPRDTNSSLDIGYHYDPLDYAFGGVDVYNNISFSAGTAVASFELDGAGGPGYGIGVSNTVTATFNGTVTAPCTFVRYCMVQEGGNGVWLNRGWLGGIVDNFFYDPANPSRLVARFTRFAHTPYDPNHFRDGNTGQPIQVQATDCEFLGGAGGYNLIMAFTNCLFNRASMGQSTADSAYSGETYREIYRNCTFYGGGIVVGHWESAPYFGISVRDCSFDGATLDFTPPWNAAITNWDWTWLDADLNAYNTNNVTFVQEADLTAMPGIRNAYVTDFNWQSSWLGNYYLPPDSSLIDAGSTKADRVGLYQFTTQTNQVKEGFSYVDIGYHYVAVDPNTGLPISTYTNGIPDYIVDSDGNGLPDWWETQYFGHIGLDANSDPQGTGYTLYQDYQSGVNPTNGSTPINVIVTLPAPGSIVP